MGRAHLQTSRALRENPVVSENAVDRFILTASQQLGVFALACGVLFVAAIFI